MTQDESTNEEEAQDHEYLRSLQNRPVGMMILRFEMISLCGG